MSAVGSAREALSKKANASVVSRTVTVAIVQGVWNVQLGLCGTKGTVCWKGLDVLESSWGMFVWMAVQMALPK